MEFMFVWIGVYRVSQRPIPLLWKLGRGKIYREYHGRGLILQEISTVRRD